MVLSLSGYSPLSTASLRTQIPSPVKTTTRIPRTRLQPLASLTSPPPPPPPSPSPSPSPASSNTVVSPHHHLPERASNTGFDYTIPNNTDGNPAVRFVQSTESNIEKVIFDFRFLALLAVGGSLAGSVLCFLNGCVYIVDAYKVYWSCCVKGIHTGQMILRLVEAIDVYLAGTVMLIFGMGLYGLFVSNLSPDLSPSVDRALKGSSLFGMFSLKERPKWMKICSLDELKTKVGHVIVMILLVKMFERSKMVTITTSMDLLSYSFCIFLSSAALYILHHLHRCESILGVASTLACIIETILEAYSAPCSTYGKPSIGSLKAASCLLLPLAASAIGIDCDSDLWISSPL